MKLALTIICIIQFFIILYIMLIRNRDKSRFNVEDYEYLILSICRDLIRQNLTDNIDEILDGVKDILYTELEKENIIIKNINDLNTKEYIRNLIYINNLIFENSDNNDIEIDNNTNEVVGVNNNNSNNTISILDSINDFYN